jgi:hypothetical protein
MPRRTSKAIAFTISKRKSNNCPYKPAVNYIKNVFLDRETEKYGKKEEAKVRIILCWCWWSIQE